jgi:transposase-like protein
MASFRAGATLDNASGCERAGDWVPLSFEPKRTLSPFCTEWATILTAAGRVGWGRNDLAKELGVSMRSLRRWSREYRKRTAAGEGVAGEPATFATASEELPAKPSSEPPVVDGGLIAAIARIELEISSLDKQRQALKMAVEILRQHSGATPE